jgi:hypothetical protein
VKLTLIGAYCGFDRKAAGFPSSRLRSIRHTGCPIRLRSLPLGQRTLVFERFVQQRLDIGLVRQAL